MKFLFLVFLALTGFANAATVASDGSSGDVQNKIDGATAGDTITLPAGQFSGWNVLLSKGVTLQGAGAGKTIIKANGTNVILNVNATSGTSRLTGLTFDGGAIQSVIVRYTGNGAGLVDHCSFTGGSASEMIHNEGLGPENKAGWKDDVTPGSANALYVEDCTFSKNPLQDQYFWGTSAMQGYYGSRTVMRHNTFNYCQVDQHGTQGNVGARWFEIYDNTFTIPDSGGNQSDYIVLRGGSGVVYGNKVTGGRNDGGGSINLYDENNGSSPLYLARGINQNPSPVYIWANDSNMHVGSGSNVKLDRDYFSSASQPATMKRWQLATDNASTTYSFKPLTYPHPMIGGGGQPPVATPTPAPTATPTPPPASTKFKHGDTVMTEPNNANVRVPAAGELVGTQPKGATGTVTGGPTWGQLPDAATGVYWWAVDFPNGVDGWIGEDNLVKSTTPAPTPTPLPTPTPTPPPTGGGPTYNQWAHEFNEAQKAWVRKNPPYPDE